MGCRFLLQGIFPTQGSNRHLSRLPHWQGDALPPCRREAHFLSIIYRPSTYYLCDYRSIRPSLSDALGHLERIHGAMQTVKSSVKSAAGPACPAEQTPPSLLISCDSLRVDILLPHKSPDSLGSTVRLYPPDTSGRYTVGT